MIQGFQDCIRGSGKEEVTYVDHNGLLAEAVKSHSGIDSAPIELNRAADTVDTATKDNCAVVVEGNIVGGGVVGRVLFDINSTPPD